MPAIYPLLIHSAFYKILRESPAAFRANVRKTLLRLRDGMWSGGTQVKRLAGSGQAVFEARLNAGDRLLFTAVRAADRDDPERLITHLQIWDVVHHDSVSRRARRNHVPEAEFLDFEALETFDITEPPPHPAAAFDEIAGGADEPLLQFLIPEQTFEPRGAEGIQGGVRWYLAPEFLLADEEDFQRMIDRAEGELELKLMRDQYEILRAPGPLLLAGGAGSGKTTIAIHRLVEARRQIENGRLLYLSYSPWLVDYAKRLYRDVTLARDADPEKAPPHFFTFSDLYRKLLPQTPNAPNLVTSESFAAWLRHSSPNIDAALAWEEVRSILKGACLNLGRTMLEEREYYELGRKRAPLFVNDRPEIFAIAQRYQQWLASTSRTDQIDLCRAAFLESRRGRGSKYDAIVCDEVQDLTELETAFVLSLSARSTLSGVMLTGDTQQIVNPTGFRWAEVRQAIVKATGASAPKPARLRRNCRSVRPLVELANTVLGLKQEIFGRYEDDGPEDAIVEGPAPIQVAAPEKRVLEAVRDFGPRCAILVLDEAEGQRLASTLETTRIFHVRDAKGLEFETVILWKILDSANGVIDRFLRGAPNTMARDARLKQFLQHLYVAVTRARRHLAVFDGPGAHPFWTASRFHGRLEIEGVETLGRLFRDSASPDEWTKEGQYYFERLRYRQAAECFRRAGLAERESASLAMHAETLEKWQEALSMWQRIGNLDRQGSLLEKLGRIAEAMEVYVRLGRKDDAARIERLLLEKAGRWAEAAKLWEDAGDFAEAARCYQRAGNKARALNLEAVSAETKKDWKRAAECWFSLKSFENAAKCFRKAKDKTGTALAMAHQHEALKNWSKAAAAYQRAGDRAKAQECKALALESAGAIVKAARLYERLGQKDRALQLYRKSGDQEAIDRFNVERADVRQSQIQAVEKLMERGSYRLAMELAERRQTVLRKRLQNFRWYISDNNDRLLADEKDDLSDRVTECRARLAEQSGAWTKAAAYWRRLGNSEQADNNEKKAIEAVTNPMERGLLLLRHGNYAGAIASFDAAGASQWSVRARALLCEQQEQWKEAAELWLSLNVPRNHARAMARLARSREDWIAAAGWHRAAKESRLASEAQRLARAKATDKVLAIHAEQAELF